MDHYNSKEYKKNVIHSVERYAFTIEEVGKIRPHIAGFNEVTPTFFEMIKEAEWVKK